MAFLVLRYYTLLLNPLGWVFLWAMDVKFCQVLFLCLLRWSYANSVGKWNGNQSDLAGLKFCQLQVRDFTASIRVPTSSFLCCMTSSCILVGSLSQAQWLLWEETSCMHMHIPRPTVDIEPPWYIKLDHINLLACFGCLIPHHKLV